MVSPISQGVASKVIPNAASEIKFVTCGPIICTPSKSSVSRSAMTLTKPSVSPYTSAFPIRLKWKGSYFHIVIYRFCLIFS